MYIMSQTSSSATSLLPNRRSTRGPEHVVDRRKLQSAGRGTGPQGHGAKYKYLFLSLSLEKGFTKF